MEGVRGEHKTPGEFRRSQNWIDRFVEQGLLVEMTGAKRDRIFLFDAYLKLYRRP